MFHVTVSDCRSFQICVINFAVNFWYVLIHLWSFSTLFWTLFRPVSLKNWLLSYAGQSNCMYCMYSLPKAFKGVVSHY